MKYNILGYHVEVASADLCCDDILKRIDMKTKSWLACMNPHSYVESMRDIEFSIALKSADWLIPDGTGVVLASKMIGGQVRERVTGSDIFDGLMMRMNRQGGFKVFFLGSTERTLQDICLKMKYDYPNVEFVGSYSPPFKKDYTEDEISEMKSLINSAKPDVLWVGMTAPKQEKWIHANINALDIKFAGAIGAVFDFYAGNVKRSHPIFQNNGLEWLPRLIQQPRRLWKRTIVSAPIFLYHVIKSKNKSK